MKAIQKHLKEVHGGKKFMDVDADLRNKSDFVKASKEALEELRVLYGADEICVFMRKDFSTYGGFSSPFGLDSLVPLFQTVKGRIEVHLPRNVAQAIAFKTETDEDDEEDYKDLAAKALQYALHGLPSDIQAKAMGRINEAMKRGGLDPDDVAEMKGTSSRKDEDDLLNDLLK